MIRHTDITYQDSRFIAIITHSRIYIALFARLWGPMVSSLDHGATPDVLKDVVNTTGVKII